MNPSNYLNHLKNRCIACERTSSDLSNLGVKFNKEHLSPDWLIRRTNTNNSSVNWFGKKLPGLSVTIPLCKECNDEFGDRLEKPVRVIFDDLEAGRGISDYEAEILVRWMWKFEGIYWHIFHPTATYTDRYTLRERVLGRIDEIRPNLSLAISRIARIDLKHNDRPMGVDSISEDSAIFISGVFSELAIMISLSRFDRFIPPNFSIYHLSPAPNVLSGNKLFYPKVGFEDDDEAVYVTLNYSGTLQKLHDRYSRRYDFIDQWLKKNSLQNEQ